MSQLIRHRLYLTARFLALLLAFGVLATLAIVGFHDYIVQRADSSCFDRQWTELIARLRKNDQAKIARSCTPEVLQLLDARLKQKERKLSEKEFECLTARDPVVGLSDSVTEKIEARCNVWIAPHRDSSPNEIERDPVVLFKLIPFSSRVWWSSAIDRQRWLDDALLAAAAFVPLLLVIAIRRWVMWLTRPAPASK